jgi:predicted neuraminidase
MRDFIFKEKLFGECHASTVIPLNGEEYMVAWFGGFDEGNDDVGIWMSQGKPDNWSKPRQVAKIRNDAHWNPVLFKEGNGKIHLYFKVAKKIPFWETWEIISADNGKTWSEARELVKGNKGGRGPVRNKIIVLSNGVWLAGASNEDSQGEKHWDVFVDSSADGGKTWNAGSFIGLERSNFKGKGVIQPTLWESSPGKVHMLVRSTNGRIYRSDSDDYGKSWCALYPINLPNNNSGIDVAKLKDGTLVLVYNPVGENGGTRSLLFIAVSYDNGVNWTQKRILESGPDADEEYSYPAIIEHNGKIALTYTWKRERIAFWEFDSQIFVK